MNSGKKVKKAEGTIVLRLSESGELRTPKKTSFNF
jgi:hypothetical protein